ncbi:acetyltransferase [Ruegeria sp. HKCCD8929]|uniref:acetyltransferase n=1 Tax=Ruegeria sp. HKCCD8929 TaxID=2683006 RepID=UPI001C2C9D95|nr:acetyltransferase [Ruegeria sp. HKCCD8929]
MIDVAANRLAHKWSRREQVARILWALAYPAFRLSPRIRWGWRRWLLCRFGATVGAQVHVYPSVRITMPWNLTLSPGCAVGDRAILYALGPISIGARATISQGAHLCAGTHDHTRADRPLLKRPITIAPDSWIAAEAFIGPGVEIGPRSIIGARAVVMKSVGPGLILAGNPACQIGTATEE